MITRDAVRLRFPALLRAGATTLLLVYGCQSIVLGQSSVAAKTLGTLVANPPLVVQGVVVQADGKVLVRGPFDTVNGVALPSITRLNPDGSLDTTFNPGGAGPAGAKNLVLSVGLQSNGGIIIAGWFTNYNGLAVDKIARLNPDGLRMCRLGRYWPSALGLKRWRTKKMVSCSSGESSSMLTTSIARVLLG